MAGGDHDHGHDHGHEEAHGQEKAHGHEHHDAGDHDAGIRFVYPQNGATVPATFDVAFGVDGRTVRPAGEDVADRKSGHHHIIIDGAAIPKGQVVPKNETHIHYGGGQTHAQLTLSPGAHSLTMQFADGAHISYGPAWSRTIEVNVVPATGARGVHFVSPADGAKVQGPVRVVFGVEGMTIRPAGEDILDKTSGHHHIIIDAEAPSIGRAVPADERHIHYGGGQTEAVLDLKPGKHKLTMQLADGAHLSYGSELSTSIEIEVLAE